MNLEEKINEKESLIVVEIKGEVVNPDVYTLNEGSIIKDLIDIAGGLTAEADISNINRAKEIVSALAEGIDPTTGEILPEDSVCNKGEVVRAFYAILNACEEDKEVRKICGRQNKNDVTA